MTSEVAVVNKAAIAVAADSAVTVGKNKVHRTAHKIFALSEAAPIGIMVYGYAEYCGVPWETVIKMFRSQANATKFKTVEQCWGSFQAFLKDKEFLTKDAQDTNLLLFTVSVLEDLKRRCQSLPSRQVTASLPPIIDSRIEYYQQLPDSKDFTPPSVGVFRRRAGSLVRIVADEVFDDIGYRPQQQVRTKILQLVLAALSSTYGSEYLSGIVLFGFGHDEIMPSVVAHEVDASSFDQVRARKRVAEAISQKNDAIIIPFADRSVMNVFVENISSDIKFFYHELMRETALKVAEQVIKSNYSPTKDEYNAIKVINERAIGKLMDDFSSDVRRFIHESSVLPLIQAVRSLPKEDLATLAEALIEVTALKKKASPDVESVGGPIDVCVVTKGDGLVWIKRKHYFDIEKNLHFSHRRLGNALRSEVRNGND